jgi:hypothetical protein
MSGPDRPSESLNDDGADRREAEGFVRDRALCPYTGKNLWLFDYGAAPELGERTADDATFAGERAAAPDDADQAIPPRRIYVFDEGFWRRDAFWIFDGAREPIVEHMRRFAALRISDWYVNRAIADIRRAATESNPIALDDFWSPEGARGQLCRAALARLAQWRALAQAEEPGSLERRGLLPREMGPDHAILLECLRAETVEDLVAAAFLLSPYVAASFRAVADLRGLSGETALRSHLARVSADPYVVACTKRAVVEYLMRILPPPLPGADVGAGETVRV